MSNPSPCVSCGACCAHFRVTFYCGENVPEEWIEFLSPTWAVMKGTNQTRPRCHCLKGEIGSEVACSIYQERPSPCREFMPSVEGEINIRCDQARSAHGLGPLIQG